MAELKKLGVWDARTREALRESSGSVQGFDWIPADVRALYRTAWEIPQRGLIDMAAARTPFLDQCAVAEPVPGDADHRQAQLDVRVRLEAGPEDDVLPALAPGDPDRPRRPAAGAAVPVPQQAAPDADAVACSLENPESCEACQ